MKLLPPWRGLSQNAMRSAATAAGPATINKAVNMRWRIGPMLLASEWSGKHMPTERYRLLLILFRKLPTFMTQKPTTETA
ncbi:hypothetical protein D3C77_735220 [compost metagenome]